MEYIRRHRGVCSRASRVVIEDGIIKELDVIGGCDGNLNGIKSICIGLDAKFVVERFRGTRCMMRSTSCPDQIAVTIEEALAEIEKAQA